MRTSDRPLQTVLRVDLPENVERLGGAVADALRDPEFDAADDALSFGLLDGLFSVRLDQDGPAVAAHSRRRLDALGPSSAHTWAVRLAEALPDDVRNHGGSILFKQAAFGDTRYASHAANLLFETIARSGNREPDESAARSLALIYRPLVDDPWPWVRARTGAGVDIWTPAEEGHVMMPDLHAAAFHALDSTQRSTALLLLLVLIQHVGSHPPEAPFMELLAARKTGWGRAAAVERVSAWGLLPEAHDLVVSWIHDAASPVLRYS